MERDEDQRNVEPPNALEPNQEIVDESLPEDDVDGPDPVATPEPLAPLEQSAVSKVPVSSLATGEADRSDGDSDSEPPLEASEELTASNTVAATRSAGNVTRIELPNEIAITPTRPPAVPRDRRSHLLPLDRDGAFEDEPNPADQIFPPEWRLPADSAPTPEPAGAEDGRPGDRGHTMPRVQVLVSLAQARTMYAEAIEEALEKQAPKYREIARSEVKQGFWEYGNQRRAADWRLRGPG